MGIVPGRKLTRGGVFLVSLFIFILGFFVRPLLFLIILIVVKILLVLVVFIPAVSVSIGVETNKRTNVSDRHTKHVIRTATVTAFPAPSFALW